MEPVQKYYSKRYFPFYGLYCPTLIGPVHPKCRERGWSNLIWKHPMLIIFNLNKHFSST